MTRKYFITPDFCVAVNYKVGSSSLARLIIHEFYPEIDANIQNGAYVFPDDGTVGWHFLCPMTTKPDKPVILLVRDPVARFVSGLRQLSIPPQQINSFLECLETGKNWRYSSFFAAPACADVHFQSQCALACGETHLFAFPEHIAPAVRLLGARNPLPRANPSPRKSSLTRSQTLRVLKYYEKDAALFSSIVAPDTVISCAPTLAGL